ncbi:hypothetical protein [Nocardia sp. NPDC057030]|uniref:hypothetical protein n=1 Tax=unclassified Nocardia TaxID=2637762 RepID=UPI00362BEA84
MTNSDDEMQTGSAKLGADRAPVQINAKIDWVLAVGAKRLAKQRGLTLNVYLARLIAEDLAKDSETIRRQFADEEQDLAAEKQAMLEALTKFEADRA